MTGGPVREPQDRPAGERGGIGHAAAILAARHSMAFGPPHRRRERLTADQRLERRDQRSHQSQPEAGAAIGGGDARLAHQRRSTRAAESLGPVGEQHAHRAAPVAERLRPVQARVVAPQRPDAPDQTRDRIGLPLVEQRERLLAKSSRNVCRPARRGSANARPVPGLRRSVRRTRPPPPTAPARCGCLAAVETSHRGLRRAIDVEARHPLRAARPRRPAGEQDNRER